MKHRFEFALALAGITGLVGCGSSESSKEAKKEDVKRVEKPAAPVITDASKLGSISGKVKFNGEKPVMKTLSMDAVPQCARQHPEPVKSEEIVVNTNGTLKNTFIWIKSGAPEGSYATPSAAVGLDQKGCMYSPHVIGVMVDQTVEFTNSDPTNHNIHPMPNANAEWNESQAPGSEKKPKKFSKPETMIPVKCNVHPWMKAYVNVSPHPFFAVTGDDGSYTIKGLPAGEYTLEAVHERLGKLETRVKVDAMGAATADFGFNEVQ